MVTSFGNPDHQPSLGHAQSDAYQRATISQHVTGTQAGQTYELTIPGFTASRPQRRHDSGLNKRQNEDGAGDATLQLNRPCRRVAAHTRPFLSLPPANDSRSPSQGTGAADEFGALIDNVSLTAITSVDEDGPVDGQQSTTASPATS